LGVRNCIGKDFAWNEVSFMLAVIIRNFKVCGDGAPFPRGSTNIVCAPEDFSITFLQRQL
jgi:cytochrome P450